MANRWQGFLSAAEGASDPGEFLIDHFRRIFQTFEQQPLDSLLLDKYVLVLSLEASSGILTGDMSEVKLQDRVTRLKEKLDEEGLGGVFVDIIMAPLSS